LTTFSGKKCLSGKVICASFFPAYRSSPVQYKRWGSVAELICQLQGSTPYGIRLSHKIYRPAPTKDGTWKDPPLVRGPLIGGYTVCTVQFYDNL
jgi:hypothetical protein